MSPVRDARPALWLRVLQFPLVRLTLLGSSGQGMAALGLALYFGLVRLIDRRRVRERPRPG